MLKVRPQPAKSHLNDPALPTFVWDKPACVDSVLWAEASLHVGDAVDGGTVQVARGERGRG